MRVDEELLKISFRLSVKRLRPPYLSIEVCNKVLISLFFMLLNIIFDIFTDDVFRVYET